MRITTEAAAASRARTGRVSQSGSPRAGRHASSRTAAAGSSDGFVHTESAGSPYTDYTAKGRYVEDQQRPLPDRYYETPIDGNVFYKGGTISYLGLLEEAVQSGEVVLDETKSVWHNVHQATKALIDDKAKPLFPWSTKLYSEDGQYIFRVENGQITGATATFCVVNGRKVTLLDMAQQLAAGVQPGDIEGDVGMLLRMDPELHAAATEIGNAKRVFEQQTEWWENGQISEAEYLSEIHPILLMLLGKDLGKDGIEALRKIFADPDYGKKGLANYGKIAAEWEME